MRPSQSSCHRQRLGEIDRVFTVMKNLIGEYIDIDVHACVYYNSSAFPCMHSEEWKEPKAVLLKWEPQDSMLAFSKSPTQVQSESPSHPPQEAPEICCAITVVILSWVEGSPVLKQEFQENLLTAIPLSSIQTSVSVIAGVSVRTVISYSPVLPLIEMKTEKAAGTKVYEIKRTSWVDNWEITESGNCTRDDLHEHSSPDKTAWSGYPCWSKANIPCYTGWAYLRRRRCTRSLQSPAHTMTYSVRLLAMAANIAVDPENPGKVPVGCGKEHAEDMACGWPVQVEGRNSSTRVEESQTSRVNIDQRMYSTALLLPMGTAPMDVLVMHVDSAAWVRFWTFSSLIRLHSSDVVELWLLARHEIALERPMMSLPFARDLQDVSLFSCLSFVNRFTSVIKAWRQDGKYSR